MDVVPAAVASGFLQPALLHFCDLLSSNARGASIKSRSLGTLHKVGPEGRFRPEDLTAGVRLRGCSLLRRAGWSACPSCAVLQGGCKARQGPVIHLDAGGGWTAELPEQGCPGGGRGSPGPFRHAAAGHVSARAGGCAPRLAAGRVAVGEGRRGACRSPGRPRQTRRHRHHVAAEHRCSNRTNATSAMRVWTALW